MITLMKNLKNAVADNARRTRKATEFMSDNVAYISENVIKVGCSSEVYQYDIVKLIADGEAELFTGNESDDDKFVPVIVISGNGGSGDIHAQVSGWGYVHVNSSGPDIEAGDKLAVSKSSPFSVTRYDDDGDEDSTDDNADAGDVPLFEAIEGITTADNDVVKVKFLSGSGEDAQASAAILWARITSGGGNNYTATIYKDRASTPFESGKSVKVWDIVDSLAVNDWIPVVPSASNNLDYECSQQIGAVG